MSYMKQVYFAVEEAKEKKMKTLLYWIKEITIMFVFTSMILIASAVGALVLLRGM